MGQTQCSQSLHAKTVLARCAQLSLVELNLPTPSEMPLLHLRWMGCGEEKEKK